MMRWTGLLVPFAAALLAAPVLPAAVPQDAPAGQDPAALAADERERQELVSQMTFVLVQQYLANARGLEEQLDLEGALAEVRKARDLDPRDRVVLDYQRQLQALLGQPEAEAALLAISARDRYESQRQQMVVLARNELAEARRAMDLEEYEQASSLVRGVVNRIAWSRDQVDWGALDGEAQALLGEVQALEASQDEVVRDRKRRAAFATLQAEEQRQAAQEELRIETLLVSATEAFDQADYESAESLAQAVLIIDQHNAQALQIEAAAQDAAREYADRIFIQKRREEFNRWRNEMERVRIPSSEIFTDPDARHWAEISALRASNQSLGLPAPDADTERINALLDETRMTAEFEEKTLVEVTNAVSFAHDIPIHVDPEVVTDLDDVGEFVTLTGLADVTVRAFLNALTEQVGEGLTWTIRHGRVYITKAEKALGTVVTKVHPIRDLAFGRTDFKGPSIREIALPGEAGDDNETTIFNSELDRVTLISPEDIQNLVRENIASASWDNGEFIISPTADANLVVSHTPQVQVEVAEFLDDLRSYSTSMVTLESRFFSISDLFIEEIGTDLRGLDPQGDFADNYEMTAAGISGNTALGFSNTQANLRAGSPTEGLDNLGDGTANPFAGAFYETGGDQIYSMRNESFFAEESLGKLLSTVGGGAFQFEILGDTEVNLVMNLVSKSKNAIEITAPTVSVYNTQRAFVTVVNQVSYIQGFDVDVATNAFIADPIIGVVMEGIVLDVQPTISYDRKYITLNVETTVAKLERPFPTITTLLGPNGSPVTFAIPVLDVQDAQTTAVVPDGGAVVLGGFKYVHYKNRTAEAPWFADIPILGFFFQEKGLSDEVTDLIVVIRARITDFNHLREEPVASR